MSLNLIEPILITGSSGFIGSNLLRFLTYNNYKVHIILRKKSNLNRIVDLLNYKNIFVHNVDLKNKKNLNLIIKKIKPQTIFHLATYGAYSHQDNKHKIQTNIINGTINLLDSCIENGFNRFINTGSNSEYGFKNKPMSELDLLEPNSYYAVFKSAISNYCSYISKAYDLPIITVRPFHIYGPFEDTKRLIPTMIKYLLNNKDMKLVSPKITRDMVYIDDAIDLYIKIASAKIENGKIYNIGTGTQTSLKEIFEIVLNITKSKSKPLWNHMNNRSWDQKIWLADMSLVKKDLKWKHKYNVKEGLKKTINWNLKNESK